MKDTTSTDNQRIIYGNDQILWKLFTYNKFIQ